MKQNPSTKALELKDWYAPSNAFWLRKRDLDMNVTGPVFDYKGKEYTVQSSKECRIWLLDTSALGGEDHRTPVYRTPLVCNEEVQFASAGIWGALSTWEDTDGTRWVLMPFWGPKHSKFKAPIEHGEVVQGAIAAFKVEEKLREGAAHARLAVAQHGCRRNRRSSPTAWCSATAAARTRRRRRRISGCRTTRPPTASRNSTHATLYVLDARTGEELWSSGDLITSFNHFSSLSVANGRVYIGTYDGKLYCFGVDRKAAGDAMRNHNHPRANERTTVRTRRTLAAVLSAAAASCGPRATPRAGAARSGRRQAPTHSGRRGCAPTRG